MTKFAFLLFQNQMSFLGFLLAFVYMYNSARKRQNVHKISLLLPMFSSWARLDRFGDEESFLTLTGFNRKTFGRLFLILFDKTRNQSKHGRKATLDNRAQLGLTLFYLGSRMNLKHLSMLFGATPSCCSRYIHRVLLLIELKLKDHPLSIVRWPDRDEMKVYASMVQRREPTISNVIGFVDGVALPICCNSDPDIQSRYYNGYHHDTTVNNVFAFAPTGKIIYASYNHPGCLHDATCAIGLKSKGVETLGSYALCVDQAFSRTGECFEKFVGPISIDARRKIAPVLRNNIKKKISKYISLRQAAEWGMKALQGTFTRIKARLPSDGQIRKRIIGCVIFLHNFRTELMGINQITTVFNKEYQQLIQVGKYDRISRYYNFD